MQAMEIAAKPNAHHYMNSKDERRIAQEKAMTNYVIERNQNETAKIGMTKLPCL